MSATDRSKRKRAAEEKNTKLRSPNFSVSQTRLSVRNIPFTLQEKELKQLFIAAVCYSAAGMAFLSHCARCWLMCHVVNIVYMSWDVST